MFENIAAIDIGQSAIKVVLVKCGVRNFQVKTYSYEDVDLGIENPVEAINDALSRIIGEIDLSDYKIVTNLPMEKSIIRNITFPFNDIEKIAEAIPFEAEENIPFKLDDVSMDFQSLTNENTTGEGKILLGAANKEVIYEYMNVFSTYQLQPVYVGLEANALFQCYDYFRENDEPASVILLDIGHNKSIIDIVINDRLQFTRSILIGTGDMHLAFSEISRKPLIESARLFENLLFDLTSLDKNVTRKNYKSIGITKPKLQKIFNKQTGIVDKLVEQIKLTVKAYFVDHEKITFDNMYLSGGGANLIGLSSILQKKVKIPVKPLNIYGDIQEKKIQTQFPIALGTVFCYLQKRRSTINFLKGEFAPDRAAESKRVYYLGLFFGMLTVVMLLVTSVTTSLLSSSQESSVVEKLKEKYTHSFGKPPKTDNPLEEAKRLANSEKAKVAKIERIFGKSNTALNVLKVITGALPKGETVEIERFVLNKTIASINGNMGSMTGFDKFKNNLNETDEFNTVKETIRGSGPNGVRFSIRIELKNDSTKKRKQK